MKEEVLPKQVLIDHSLLYLPIENIFISQSLNKSTESDGTLVDEKIEHGPIEGTHSPRYVWLVQSQTARCPIPFVAFFRIEISWYDTKITPRQEEGIRLQLKEYVAKLWRIAFAVGSLCSTRETTPTPPTSPNLSGIRTGPSLRLKNTSRAEI
jgi:hypothetical protein